MKTSILTKHQKLVSVNKIIVDGQKGRIKCEIRYNDECGNGHNSFSITGTVFSHPTSTRDQYWDRGGCIHDEIAKHFPEFKHLIKWHSMTSEAPLHYIANTLYHANESLKYNFTIDSKNKLVQSLHMFNVPADFLTNNDAYKSNLQKVFIDYDLNTEYQEYRRDHDIDKRGLYDDYCLYNYCLELESFLDLNKDADINNYRIKKEKGSEYREINLEYARSTAIAPDATLCQLQSKEWLEARLPQLQAAFITDIEALGFVY